MDGGNGILTNNKKLTQGSTLIPPGAISSISFLFMFKIAFCSPPTTTLTSQQQAWSTSVPCNIATRIQFCLPRYEVYKNITFLIPKDCINRLFFFWRLPLYYLLLWGNPVARQSIHNAWIRDETGEMLFHPPWQLAALDVPEYWNSNDRIFWNNSLV